ncbi:MAG: hypothetical protein QHC90_04960 [Shinella sp.]|nr:hypothetical protein [Shinella sp.]
MRLDVVAGQEVLRLGQVDTMDTVLGRHQVIVAGRRMSVDIFETATMCVGITGGGEHARDFYKLMIAVDRVRL